MAKKIEADAKLSGTTVSGQGKANNAFPVAADIKAGAPFPSPLQKLPSGRDIKDEMLDDKDVVLADAELAVPDSAVTASDQFILMAQADSPLSPGSDPAKVEQAESGSSATDKTQWLWLGAGVVAVGAGAGIAMSGGGGGGDSTSSSSSPTVSNTLSGRVTDGPISGAKLYVDENHNGIYDAGDTPLLDANGIQVTTNADGTFSFVTNENFETKQFVTNGGIDTVTGEVSTMDYTAPIGYHYLNPITSLIAAYMEANPGLTANQAETAVELALGLPSLDYSNIDLASATASLAVQQVAAILAVAAITAEESGAATDGFGYLAANLGSGGSTNAIITALSSDRAVNGYPAEALLADTVEAVKAATSLDSVGNALNNTFFNDPPSFTSGVSVNVAENNIFVMTVAATDPDPNHQNVTYSISGGIDQESFTINPNTGVLSFVRAPDFEAPTDAGVNNEFFVEVTANDGNGGSTAQTITVTVTDVNEPPPNSAPSITSGATGTVVENAAISTVVYTVAATDAESNTLTYSLTGADAAFFNINATSGEVTLKASADYETKNSYNINVVATDNGTGSLSDSHAVTINVTNDITDDVSNNIAPSITSGATGTVAENAAISTVVYTVAATDANIGQTLTYSLSGTDAASFNINGTSGAVTLKAPADYETKNSYSINVIATDNGTGSLSDSHAVTINVTNVNEAPSITSGTTGTVAENADISTVVYTVTATDPESNSLTYSLTGTDAAAFNINGTTGAVTLKDHADYETKNSYSINVVATDNGTGLLHDSHAVTINVTDRPDGDIVVERYGAYVDANSDGIHQTGEVAITNDELVANLHANDVTVHFNDLPMEALNLTGFGTDDKIEFDWISLNKNPDIFCGTPSELSRLTVSASHVTFGASCTVDFIVNQHTVKTLSDFSGNSYHNNYAFSVIPESSINGTKTAVIAYWSDYGNALNFQSNLLPNYNSATSNTSTVLENLNAGTEGGLVEFVFPATTGNVVVERDGAFIDANSDGIHQTDGSEIAISNADMFDNLTNGVDGRAVTVHFNDVPLNAIDLTGFGLDDKIEFDVTSFQVHGLLNSDSNSLAEVQINTPSSNYTYFKFGSPETSITLIGAKSGWWSTTRNMTDFNDSSHRGNYGLAAWGMQTTVNNYRTGIIAYWSDDDNALNLQSEVLPNYTGKNAATILDNLNDGTEGGLVDFIWPDYALSGNVVVERGGAYIDANSNGILDSGDVLINNTMLTANLLANHVTIHFNDVPLNALNLTGFGTDDKIEFDWVAFGKNGIICDTTSRPLTGFKTTPSGVTYSSSCDVYFIVHQHRISTLTDYNGRTYDNKYGFYVQAERSVSGVSYSESRAIAYWSDAGNPLNEQSNLLPNYTGHNTTEVLYNLNFNLEGGVVDFITPHPVVVIADASGAHVDANLNGILDAEDSVDAVFTAGGNADLKGETPVTIHFHAAPDTPLDLSGFGSDDLIEIDMNAYYWGDDSIARANQSYTKTKCNHQDTPVSSRSSLIACRFWDNGTTTVNGFAAITVSDYEKLQIGACITHSSEFSELSGTPATVALMGKYNPIDDHNVEFVHYTPQLFVIVEGSGVYIDSNQDGIVNGSESTSSVDFSDNANLMENRVTIHFHDAPATPLDLSGYGADDLIEIDMNAYYWGNDLIARNSQRYTKASCNHGSSSRSSLIARPTWDNGTTTFKGFAAITTTSHDKLQIGACTTSGGNFVRAVGTSETVALMGRYNPIYNHDVQFVVTP